MFPPGTRGRARGLPYTMDAFMLGMGMLSESTDKPAHTLVGGRGAANKRKIFNLYRYIMLADKAGPINMSVQDWQLCTYKASAR